MGSVLSGIGTALGLGGGVQTPNLYQPFTAGQVDQSYQNTQNSLQAQQDLVKALQQANGVGNQSQVYNQLQQVAAGQGLNPAQAMLNNATGQNVANQAALAAGQRGGSANAGLIARQAAQIGSNAQQQAVGQGAALQAQQGLNALGQAGQMANQQVGNQIQASQGAAGSALQGQQNLFGAAANQNNARNAQYGQQLQNQQHQGDALLGAASGLFNAAGPALSMLGGGSAASAGGGGGLASAARPGADMMFAFADGGQVPASPRSHLGKYAHGGQVSALVSPGEKYLTPNAVNQVAQGANPMTTGQTIPGKVKVSGATNDYANDTVKKKLDVGGVVLPRSVTQAKDSDQKAREFVAAVLKQKALRK